jgi:hypothetical protein
MEIEWGLAIGLEQDSDRCSKLTSHIKSLEFVAPSIVLWLVPAVKALAFSKDGCRVIQEALHFANIGDQILLVNELKGSFDALYKSPWGNHVVMKIIEKMTPGTIGFILEEISGKAVTIARHQYGCRVMERIIEHFPADQTAGLVREILAQAEPLSRHPYGNFVVQHLFEHGAQPCKDVIIQQIIGDLPKLAKHRISSNVVQKAIQYCNENVQLDLVSVLVNAEGEDSLVELACSRYGSFVVRELIGMQGFSEVVYCKLFQDRSRLAKSQYGKRALAGLDAMNEGTECESFL